MWNQPLGFLRCNTSGLLRVDTDRLSSLRSKPMDLVPSKDLTLTPFLRRYSKLGVAALSVDLNSDQ
jgi:hypothetical protein